MPKTPLTPAEKLPFRHTKRITEFHPICVSNTEAILRIKWMMSVSHIVKNREETDK